MLHCRAIHFRFDLTRHRCYTQSKRNSLSLVAHVIDVVKAYVCSLVFFRCSSPSFSVASILLFMNKCYVKSFSRLYTQRPSQPSGLQCFDGSRPSSLQQRNEDFICSIAVSVNFRVQNAAGNRGTYLLPVYMRTLAGTESNGPMGPAFPTNRLLSPMKSP